MLALSQSKSQTLTEQAFALKELREKADKRDRTRNDFLINFIFFPPNLYKIYNSYFLTNNLFLEKMTD